MAEYYAMPYVTSQGERWDEIAYAFYGNALKTEQLVAANPQYADMLLFPAGCVLNIPKLEEETAESLPPWKQS